MRNEVSVVLRLSEEDLAHTQRQYAESRQNILDLEAREAFQAQYRDKE